jgi:hypothetical protein
MNRGTLGLEHPGLEHPSTEHPRIDAALPPGTAAGTRYPEAGMRAVGL